MRRMVMTAWLVALVSVSAPGAEVSGRVAMPDVCSPGVSPAVVILEPKDGRGAPRTARAVPAEVALIDQRGLQFVPRVQAIALGQGIRFTNADAETHNVHVLSPGFNFNESMAPGQPREWTPKKAGVVRLGCDVHSHMRGYVVVSATPWVGVCSREGDFRLTGVPDGHYVLNVWHEMGEPLRRDLTVAGGSAIDLKTLTLSVPTPARGPRATAPPRPWADVIDQIGLKLASSLDAAGRPGELARAQNLAEDAYWGEFEASDMETAVRGQLGFAKKGEIERQFFAIISDVREVAEGRREPSEMAGLTRKLLLALVQASGDLNRKGVTDRAHLFTASPAPAPALIADVAPTGPEDHRGQLGALDRGFGRVRAMADQGAPHEAASAMTSVYFGDFEPMERFVAVRKPQDVRPLEVEFNAIRGEVGAGLKGEALASRLAGLRGQVEAALGRSMAQASGTSGPAFAASLITITREGVEIILLLTMLVALVAKTGQPGALRAIWWGVGLALLASAGTAIGLNRMVASAQGRTREIVEGAVMLAAAGVLFYVSYWLISQSESRRWMEFLKRQARRGAELGGHGTLALTAFLAVYREGAETALMYQAMIGGQGGARAGLLGLAAGLGVGLVLLAAIALAIRATSVRLPLRAFFKVTGFVLFAMAVIFAGNGVFALQSSGILKVTPLGWLGPGLPAIGLHPNVQALSVQGLLLAGAALALLLMLAPDDSRESRHVGKAPTAGVGA